MKNISPKIVVILGPTASGKSSTALKLAQKFNGEIISADSRQIYQGMEINSGAEVVEAKIIDSENIFVSHNIPHYFVSNVDPTEEFNVVKFKREAEKIITAILARQKLPIICGGTGFWIKSLVDGIAFPQVKPNWKLREQLKKKTSEELFNQLKKIDLSRSKTIDAKNKVRLIRALEICKAIGKVPPFNDSVSTIPSRPNWDFLQIGIRQSKETLHQRIKLNVNKRMQQGMIAEIERLHQSLSWEKIQSFGLSFNLIPQYLQGEISSQKELREKIYLAEKNYAKRQMTWFKKDKRIQWIHDYASIEKLVTQFLA